MEGILSKHTRTQTEAQRGDVTLLLNQNSIPPLNQEGYTQGVMFAARNNPLAKLVSAALYDATRSLYT